MNTIKFIQNENNDIFAFKILTKKQAIALFKTNMFEIYELYDDDTEGLIRTFADLQNSTKQLGIEIGFITVNEPVWVGIETDNCKLLFQTDSMNNIFNVEVLKNNNWTTENIKHSVVSNDEIVFDDNNKLMD